MLTVVQKSRLTAAQQKAYAQATLQIQAALDTLSEELSPDALAEALTMCKHKEQYLAQKTDSIIWARNRG